MLIGRITTAKLLTSDDAIPLTHHSSGVVGGIAMHWLGASGGQLGTLKQLGLGVQVWRLAVRLPNLVNCFHALLLKGCGRCVQLYHLAVGRFGLSFAQAVHLLLVKVLLHIHGLLWRRCLGNLGDWCLLLMMCLIIVCKIVLNGLLVPHLDLGLVNILLKLVKFHQTILIFL
jgi:hypothetical protein